MSSGIKNRNLQTLQGASPAAGESPGSAMPKATYSPSRRSYSCAVATETDAPLRHRIGCKGAPGIRTLLNSELPRASHCSLQAVGPTHRNCSLSLRRRTSTTELGTRCGVRFQSRPPPAATGVRGRQQHDAINRPVRPQGLPRRCDFCAVRARPSIHTRARTAVVSAIPIRGTVASAGRSRKVLAMVFVDLVGDPAIRLPPKFNLQC